MTARDFVAPDRVLFVVVLPVGAIEQHGPEIMALRDLRYQSVVLAHRADHRKLFGIRPATPTHNRTQTITAHATLA